MKKLLICGDSFSCKWPSTNNIGWPTLLESDYDITNLSQAGVSEYKIYKQLSSIDIKKYDKIIVCHTSPYRIPIEVHPYFKKETLHKNSDLIFKDVESKKFSSFKMFIAYYFFKFFFNIEYFKFSHLLILNEIKKVNSNIVHITFFKLESSDVLDLSNYFMKFRGDVNHLSKEGNFKVYSHIKNILS